MRRPDGGEAGDVIVCGYDGSQEAQRALEVAGRLLGGPAVVVHVFSALPPQAAPLAAPGAVGTGVLVDPEDERRREEAARAVAEEGARRAQGAGLQAEPLVVSGGDTVASAWRALLEVAAERGADAVVVGRRGVSRIEGALLGSVSNGLVQHAHLPVLVVPPPDGDGD